MDKVYCITNKINGKRYIGYTAGTIEGRVFTHLTGNGNKLVKQAVDKYGRENFEYELMYEGHDALQKEIEFIEKEKPEYNMCPGGGVPPNQKGNRWKMSEESKAKLRKPKPPRTPEHCKAISESQKGRVPWNKGKKGAQVGWNKGLRTSPKVCLWEVTKQDGSTEKFENLILWCEENGYKKNTLKARYYKNNFPYLDIVSLRKL